MFSPKMADPTVFSGYSLVFVEDNHSNPGFLFDHLSCVLSEMEAFYSYYGFWTGTDYLTNYYDDNLKEEV